VLVVGLAAELRLEPVVQLDVELRLLGPAVPLDVELQRLLGPAVQLDVELQLLLELVFLLRLF
jgi:hypothetical protein